MFRTIASTITLLLLLGTTEGAFAAAGCPGGYTPQGGVCKPYRGPNVPYRYGYPYAPPPPPQYYYAPRGPYFPPDPRYGARGCPGGFTVQDGWCKPYRGY
jgi:hypothetical protein